MEAETMSRDGDSGGHMVIETSESDELLEKDLDSQLKARVVDLRRLWAAQHDHLFDEESNDLVRVEDRKAFACDYPGWMKAAVFEHPKLSFVFVKSETFGDEQLEPYWRYRPPWGSLQDEFRIFSGGPKLKPYRIEYWLRVGAVKDYTSLSVHLRLAGDDLEVLLEYWRWFQRWGLTDDRGPDLIGRQASSGFK